MLHHHSRGPNDLFVKVEGRMSCYKLNVCKLPFFLVLKSYYSSWYQIYAINRARPVCKEPIKLSADVKHRNQKSQNIINKDQTSGSANKTTDKITGSYTTDKCWGNKFSPWINFFCFVSSSLIEWKALEKIPVSVNLWTLPLFFIKFYGWLYIQVQKILNNRFWKKKTKKNIVDVLYVESISIV